MNQNTTKVVTIAVDTGGTFTDLLGQCEGEPVHQLKVPSTPDDPSRAILSGVHLILKRFSDVKKVVLKHGTTVGTNALLERTGGPTGLLTNEGFEDILAIGRQNRPEIYALHPQGIAALIPREMVFSAKGRQGPTGAIVQPYEDPFSWVDRHIDRLSTLKSLAIGFIHAYANPTFERSFADAICNRCPQLHLTCSAVLAPVHREYERLSTAVLNAYLSPVMDAYLRALLERLHTEIAIDVELLVMGSAGALLSTEEVLKFPALTCLSGPAGGVRGAWARQGEALHNKLLTLDMGGTSTDVAVVEDTLTPEDECSVGRLPLRVPIIPIETVGAGGGSIARLDAGGALVVGPESAGAMPGPACYGKGGTKPTVTDAHLALDRIATDENANFILRKDLALASIKPLASALKLTVRECAHAIVQVAEANMARACRRILTQRNADAAEVSLVAFGGAGGLHACELADTLGCNEVYIPPFAGLLSAFGILHSEPMKHLSRPIHTAESKWTKEMLKDAHSSLEVGIQRAVAGQYKRNVLADIRYLGQANTLPIPIRADMSPSDLRQAFDAAHTRRYGYDCPDRDAYWVQLRVFEGPKKIPKPSLNPAHAANPIVGPSRLNGYGSTLHLPDGWTAQATDTGGFVCQRVVPTVWDHADQGAARLEIYRHRLATIAEEMGETLRKASFSANIKERLDYSCAIFDASGELLCHAAHIPVHLGSTGLSVRAAIEHHQFRPGDTVILNDPFSGGTHLPDVTLVTSVHASNDGPAVFYVANRAHHADVGGDVAGSFCPITGPDGKIKTLTIDSEGVRIKPSLLTPKMRDIFKNASRTPDEREGDLRAQEAANRVGAARLLEWIAHLGFEPFLAQSKSLLDYSERLMRRTISRIPDGQYCVEDYLDGDGGAHSPLPLPLRFTVQGSEATLDFSAAPDAVNGPVNAVRAIVMSAAFYCFRCLAGHGIPANEGLMRPIKVLTRPGSWVDALPPSAVAAGNVETSQRLVDTIYLALSQALPDQVPAASAGTMNNILFGGFHQRTGRAFVHYETVGGGGGASIRGAGLSGMQTHMTNTLNTPVESLENEFPVRIEQYALRPGVRPRGNEIPGGQGIVRVYRFLEPVELTLMADRRKLPPWGLHGAQNGQVGIDEISRQGGPWERVKSKVTLHLEAGDRVRIMTPSGGHWRPPKSSSS